MVKQGRNAIAVTLGEGWFAGRLMGAGSYFYGSELALLSQIEIEYEGGKKVQVISDDSWRVNTNGPILSSEIYNGEIYDARKELPGWMSAHFDDSNWEKAKADPALGYDNLVASIAPSVIKNEALKPKRVFTTPLGEKVIDFGQNLVGWIQFKVNGKAGDRLIISHAEVLTKEGNFYISNLRSAKQRVEYYLKGGGNELYEPHFTFQGFRYIKVEGNTELITDENIEAIVLHSQMEPTGSLITSNELLNKLQQNIKWGQKGNFVDIPTDCPQRDEREGWTGDAQVFFNTASYNMNVSAFFRKWLFDLKADQQEDGAVPQVIPNVWGKGEQNAGSAGWADAATIIPWQFFKVYGDTSVLSDQYTSMKAWIKFIETKSTNYLWDKSWHHGDWLYFMPKDVWDHDPASTDKTLIAQAFYAYSLQNVIYTAGVLKYEKDVEYYSAILMKVKNAFIREFMSESGALLSNTQTAYVLALYFDLLPEQYRARAAKRLVANIGSYGNHLSTGFLGTPYLCHVLSRFGYSDVAYTLLMQESYPSWLYPVKMGATTIWERWDGIRPDGSFQSKEMNSFNHYAYGAIGDWMYKNIAGIDQTEQSSGYKHFRIAPNPGGGLTFAHATLETIYGTVSSSWKMEGGHMSVTLEIPANTTAVVTLPLASGATVMESGMKWDGGSHSVIGSGKYNFRYRTKI